MPGIFHNFVDPVADDPTIPGVRPSNWNASHTDGSGNTISVRTLLSVDTNFYVSATGSNSNDGLTPATAQATLQHMVNIIANNYDGGGHNITVNVGAGTFAGAQIVYPPNYNFYSVLGAGLASTTVRDGGGLYCLGPNTVAGSAFIFGGMTLDANNTNTVGFEPQGAGLSFLGDSTFSGTNPVAFTASGGQGGQSISLGSFGTNDFQSPADMTISGTWIAAFAILFQGNIANPGFGNIILSGTPVWTQGFIDAFGGQYEMDANFMGSGSTGPALSVSEPSIVNFNVPNNLPGNSFGIFFGQLGYYDGQLQSFIVDNGRRLKTLTNSYQIVIDDRDVRLQMNVAGANTVTIPTNATIGGLGMPPGAEIRVTQVGAGATTIVAAIGVTVHNVGVVGGQWQSVLLYNRALDEWVQTSV